MTSKEIRFDINQLLVQQQAIALKGFTTESRSAFDKMQKEVESLEAALKIEERLAEGRSFERSPRHGVGVSTSIDGNEQRKLDASVAFRDWARTGQINAEHRDVLTTTNSGQAVIPQEFLGTLFEALKFYGPVATKVTQKRTDTGAPMKVVLSDDTENGLTLLATEGTSTPAETDPAFSSKLIAADTTTGGLVKVSFEELEDSYFNLDTFIRSKFSIRYARGIENAITTGKDSSGTVLPNFPDSLLSTATVGTTTASIAAGIGWDDITAMLGALDAAYQVNASWVMSPAIRSFLLAAKDGFGRPFWTPNPSSDSPFDKLLGFPVVLNSALPTTVVASGTPVLFGDLERSYLLRTVGEPTVLRLSERYADQLMVGFYLYSRQAGCSLAVPGAPSPLLSLKIAAA